MPPMFAAEKAEKRAGIEFVNTELCASRIILCQPACAPLSEEAVSLPWKDEYRLEEKKGMQNHCCDTLLYGEKAHMAYLNEAPAEKVETLRVTPDDPAYIEREREALRAEQSRDWWDR